MCRKLRSRLPLSLIVLLSLLACPLTTSAQESDSKGEAEKAAKKPKAAAEKSDKTESGEQAETGDIPKPVEPQYKEVQKDETPKDLRIIQLKNSETQQMLQLLAFWFQHQNEEEQDGESNAGSPAAAASPGARLSMLMSDVRIATDDKAKTLIFRGPTEKLDRIESVVADFDVAPEEFKPQAIGGVYITPVDDSHVHRSGELLSQLGITTSNIMVGKTNFIVIRSADEAEIEQATKILEFAASQGKSDDQPSTKPNKSPKNETLDDAGAKQKESKQSAPKKKQQAEDE